MQVRPCALRRLGGGRGRGGSEALGLESPLTLYVSVRKAKAREIFKRGTLR